MWYINYNNIHLERHFSLAFTELVKVFVSHQIWNITAPDVILTVS